MNPPGDRYEQEADRVADQVLRAAGADREGVDGGACSTCPGGTRGQVGGRVQGMGVEASGGIPVPAPPIVQDVLRSPGRPLDAAARAYFEPRFGVEFDRVRIHTDADAARSADALGALAYTVGRDIVFAAGRYAPETAEGKRLLAHELTHVQQQRGASVPGTRGVIQRQPAPTPRAPGAGSGAPDPGFEEEADRPSFRVRIVAHASPRWRSARSAADADRRNLELSRRRAEAVRRAVEAIFADHFGGASVPVDVTVEEQPPGTIGVESEARGSRDTLVEARGDRSDDAQERRRVDVIIESSQRISGMAGASRPARMRSTDSRFWYVSVDMSAGASIGAAGSLLVLTLTNASTGQSMHGKVWAAGGGPKARIGTSASIWSDPTGFSTDTPVNFADFEGRWVRYTSVGLNMFIGYEKAYISFIGLGSGAQSIDVGGWNTGTVGVGGAVVAGKLSLDGPPPPRYVPIKGSDRTTIPYERTERGEDVYTVLFATQSDVLSDIEMDILDSFIASVVASKR
ncbi:MAG TPA: DUF4157 domain-containing protein [Longimicrobiales bacterium]